MKDLILGASPGKTITAAVVAGIVVPALCLLVLRMPAEQSLFLGAVALLAAAIVRFPPDGFDLEFPEPPAPVRDRGARREAFRLSWNVAGRQDQVGSTLVARLQQIAGRRLADHGLRLSRREDAEQIIALVGRPAYQVLRLPPGAVTTTRHFQHTLGAVEQLAGIPPAAHHPHLMPDQPDASQESDVTKENG